VGLSDKELLRAMVEAQAHRGPDSSGFFLDASVGLGTDRLSIIDIEKGDQPIHNEDETLWITYNGEVYNYVELKAELEPRGHRFYTNGDTETVLHAYEEWGEEFLARLRGMFAFAIWDSKKKTLLLARDRFGKKPLYYTSTSNAFLFSSELKGILQFEGLKRELSREAMDFFFTYFYIPSPLTIFKGIHKLPPGHYLVKDEDGVRVRQYWDMRFNPSQQTEERVIDRLFDILTESVRIRLRSDVPLGSFLSGGIDSSIVTAIMRKNTDAVKTVTVGFEDEDEHIRYGRIVSNYLDTDHKEYVVDAGSMSILPELIWHFDEPFADSSFIPTYYVSKMMRREVKVALTGDGGDEMFMGYPFLKDQGIYRLYKSLPQGVRRAGLRLIVKLPRKTRARKMASHALEKNYGEQDFFGRYIMRMVVFAPQTLPFLYSDSALASGVHPTLGFLERAIDQYRNDDPLDAVNYATIKGYLSEMILTKVDRMGMAVSLEPRCPLLDHELAEYVGTLPSSMKYNGGTTKYVLKKLAIRKELLPRDVISRKKLGFGPPVDRWLGSDWHGFSEQVVEKAGRTGLFNEDFLSKLLRDRYVNSAKIFGLTVFTLWHAQYVENQATKPMNIRRLV